MEGNKQEALKNLQKEAGDQTGRSMPCTEIVRVAAYIRVSSDSADQENSYETQKRYFTELLSRNPGWTGSGIYSDYGTSGTTKEKRTGYNRLLRHCMEGRIDRVVCKSISRFARNTRDFMAALKILQDNHVTIFFEREGLDTADFASGFIFTTLAAIAQEEARSISANVNWGNQKRFQKGQARNYDIYGYRFATGEDAMEIMEDGYQLRRVEIIEEEAKIVRRIYHEFENGKRYADIARGLNLDKIPEPNHGREKRHKNGRRAAKEGIETGWRADMISRILQLERYCGDVLLQKTYTPDFLTHKSLKNNGVLPRYLARDHHPAIISREQFERVQELRSPKTAPEKRKTAAYPFSGRLICSTCGRAYTVRNVNANPIWFCPTAALNNGKTACRAEKVYEEQIIRMFRKAFTDRFRLLAESVADDVSAADIISGRYGEDDTIACCFDQRADSFTEQVRQRLMNIQKMDFAERDRAFLKRQIYAKQAALTIQTPKETVCNAGADDRGGYRTGDGISGERLRIEKIEKEKEKLEQRLADLESYWEQLEKDYAERARVLAWIDTLPEGRKGTVEFLNELCSTYVKAFALSVTIHDPLHYTVHWFDDAYTDVELYSNVEDFRCTAAYYDSRRKREKSRRK